MHQVLERYHAAGGETLTQLLDLFDACWRRGGFREGSSERELRAKARAALERYHARLHGQDSEPVWFERQFSLRIGPHHLRGRVDRVDRLRRRTDGRRGGASDGGGERERYELIDYKTSRPRTAEQLRDDIQLSLYALAARESWQVEASSRAYYYVLDDLIVRLPRRDRRAAREGDRDGGRRGHHGPALRADSLEGGVFDLRLPDRLPGRRALSLVREWPGRMLRSRCRINRRV